jgi:hypothetical protein
MQTRQRRQQNTDLTDMLNQFHWLARVRFPGKGNEGRICVPHTLKMKSDRVAGTHETDADLVRLVERGITVLSLLGTENPVKPPVQRVGR